MAAVDWQVLWKYETLRIVDLVYVAKHSYFHILYPRFPAEPARRVTLGECSGDPLRVEHPILGSVLVYHEDAERAVRAHFGEDEGEVFYTPSFDWP